MRARLSPKAALAALPLALAALAAVAAVAAVSAAVSAAAGLAAHDDPAAALVALPRGHLPAARLVDASVDGRTESCE